MPRFQFRLQTLYRLREAARDERREQLADALRVDDALRSRGEELANERRTARELQALGTGRVDIDRLLEAQRYEASLLVEIAHVDQQRARVAEEVERRRTALVEADRELKVLEKLRELRRSEHRLVEAVEENKRLDEAGARDRTTADAVGSEVET